MKKIVFILMMSFLANFSFAQEWTNQELEKANTAKDVKDLTSEEKDVIKYINLARLYPKKFVRNEIDNSNYSDFELSYMYSLRATLMQMRPCAAISFDQEMYDFASCFAIESRELGTVGHKRKNCNNGYFAECCSYGFNSGRGIALQLLIDAGVPSLGHRKICLDKTMIGAGVNIQVHPKHDYCCVLDFSIKNQ